MANITKDAQTVLEKRYFIKELSENQPEQLFRRVAHYICQAEEEGVRKAWEDLCYKHLDNLEFMFSSPCLMNAGSPNNLNQLSSCFTVPVEDSMEGIFDALKWQALITKSCGGTGFSFSDIRSNGSNVQGIPVASGPVSFMKIFNEATSAVMQGRRRGANMGVLQVDHPDILEFIECKKDNKSLKNFNISVAITRDFMKALHNGEKYKLIDPHTKQCVQELDAKFVWDKIAENAWLTADPGMFFIDRANDDNPVPHLGMVKSGNPCAEYVFIPWGACNLASINLAKCIKNGNIDWDKLSNLVHFGVRMLDNMITMNQLPLPQIKDMVDRTRPIGLGVMGWHHMLIQLGISYDSNEALKIADKVGKFIRQNAEQTSKDLATERGMFPEWEKSIWGNKDIPVRNSTLLSIAPTGTISLICNTTSGIEPLFSVAFTRNVESMNNMKIYVADKLFEQMAKDRGFYSEDLIKKIYEKGTVVGIKEIPEDIQELFKAAQDISYEQHLRMQAAWQNNVDLSISKTINMAKTATIDDVRKAYELAYDLGLKGTTVYRDGCKEGQVLVTGATMSNNNQTESKYIKPKKRPKKTSGDTFEYAVGCGKIYVTVNKDKDGNLLETFVNNGSIGGCAGYSQGFSRMISAAARSGVDPDDLIDQCHSVKCPNCKGLEVKSCPDAIGKAIESTLNKQPKQKAPTKKEQQIQRIIKICPECGAEALPDGCGTCAQCGYSSCS
ncbi:MAG: adenosylcobalamin-dependent ribonucleoside-diphosphate reductase [Bacteroidota bacterium]|nr:adenosylcobalamin-dependent ribonucleoside-diphosphate reductase [Bacteroidota bacterium]